MHKYESVSFVSSGCEKIPACECAFYKLQHLEMIFRNFVVT